MCAKKRKEGCVQKKKEGGGVCKKREEVCKKRGRCAKKRGVMKFISHFCNLERVGKVQKTIPEASRK